MQLWKYIKRSIHRRMSFPRLTVADDSAQEVGGSSSSRVGRRALNRSRYDAIAVQTRDANYPIANIGQLMSTLGGLQAAP